MAVFEAFGDLMMTTEELEAKVLCKPCHTLGCFHSMADHRHWVNGHVLIGKCTNKGCNCENYTTEEEFIVRRELKEDLMSSEICVTVGCLHKITEHYGFTIGGIPARGKCMVVGCECKQATGLNLTEEGKKDMALAMCVNCSHNRSWHLSTTNKDGSYCVMPKCSCQVFQTRLIDHKEEKTEEVEMVGKQSTSVKPRFALIPYDPLVALAGRFELGEVKHAKGAWNALSDQAALENEEWILKRAEHIIHHTYQWIMKRKELIPDDGDDDAAAIMWGGCLLSEARRVKLEKEPSK